MGYFILYEGKLGTLPSFSNMPFNKMGSVPSLLQKDKLFDYIRRGFQID